MHRGRQTERDRTERRESSRDSKGKTEAGCPEWGSYSKQGGLGFQSCGRGRRTPTEAAASSLTGQDPTWLLSLSPRPPPPPIPRLPGALQPARERVPQGLLCAQPICLLCPPSCPSPRESSGCPPSCPPRGQGDPAWASAGVGRRKYGRCLPLPGMFQARALQIQSRHPPWESERDRCTPLWSPWRSVHLATLTGSWAWPSKLLSPQNLSLNTNAARKSARRPQGTGASLPAAGGLADQDTPKQAHKGRSSLPGP